MVTVVPNKINVAGKSYREGVDLSAEKDCAYWQASRMRRLSIHLPTPGFQRSLREVITTHCDGIISIHASREIYSSYSNDGGGAGPFAGNCPIAVIDSQNLCAGAGDVGESGIEGYPAAADTG